MLNKVGRMTSANVVHALIAVPAVKRQHPLASSVAVKGQGSMDLGAKTVS